MWQIWAGGVALVSGVGYLYEKARKKAKITPTPSGIVPNPHVDPKPPTILPSTPKNVPSVPANPAVPNTPNVPIVMPTVVDEPPFDPGEFPQAITHNAPKTAGAKNAAGVLVLSGDDPKQKQQTGKTQDPGGTDVFAGADASSTTLQGQKGLVNFFAQKKVINPDTKTLFVYPPSAADGQFGPQTQKATWAFQRYANVKRGANLTEDGLFGKNTNAALALFDVPVQVGTTVNGSPIISIVPTHSDLATVGTAIPQAHALYDYLYSQSMDGSPTADAYNSCGQLCTAFQTAHNADPHATSFTGHIGTSGHYDPATSAALTMYTGTPIPPDPTATQTFAQAVDPQTPGPANLAAQNLYAYLKVHGNDKSYNLVVLTKAFQHAANTDPKFAGPANPNTAMRIVTKPLAEDGSYGPATASALAIITLDAIKS